MYFSPQILVEISGLSMRSCMPRNIYLYINTVICLFYGPEADSSQ